MKRKKIRITSKINKDHRRVIECGIDENGSIVAMKNEPMSTLHPHLHFDNDGWFVWCDNMPQ